jgi:hypothetical protein
MRLFWSSPPLLCITYASIFIILCTDKSHYEILPTFTTEILPIFTSLIDSHISCITTPHRFFGVKSDIKVRIRKEMTAIHAEKLRTTKNSGYPVTGMGFEPVVTNKICFVMYADSSLSYLTTLNLLYSLYCSIEYEIHDTSEIRVHSIGWFNLSSCFTAIKSQIRML